MYRKFSRACALLLVLLSLLTCAGPAGASETGVPEIALTSVGQSPDAVMVNVVLKRQKIAAVYEAAMQGSDLAGQKILIAVVGGSSKGLGAAGVDKNQELERCVSLINAAKSKGMKVLVMHVGGEGRRGDLSDAFIEGVVPLADSLIVVKGGNADGLFDKLKPGNVTMREADGIQTVWGSLEAVLKECGVGS
jgi:hypothetical protein